ncbi:organic solute carrier partner 1 [Brevipalpus obovatus]|uniref:organic solute carrier partner 1 n=1 Tax=Brevipalpus obovatus TaxID=246614 RepID=UPI003D9F89BB
MSDEAYPYLYLCSTCEMLYIVQHRLAAQSIDQIKTQRVLGDILTSVFSSSTIEQIFIPKQLMSLKELQNLINRIAHCSIMKLSEDSMNKLFDLVIMVVKYQLVFVQNSLELFDVVTNHLDSMMMLTENVQLISSIEMTRKRFLTHFGPNHIYRLRMVRTVLLTYLAGIKTKVSALMKMGTQDEEGGWIVGKENLVSCFCQIPGTINYFNEKQEIIRTLAFDPLALYRETNAKTNLGLNIYINETHTDKRPDEQVQMNPDNKDRKEHGPHSFIVSEEELEVEARRGAILLANLLGRDSGKCEQLHELDLIVDSDALDKTSNKNESEPERQIELQDTQYRSKLLEVKQEICEGIEGLSIEEDDLLEIVDSMN